MQLGIVPLDCVCKKECEGIASQLAVGMLFGDHRGKSPEDQLLNFVQGARLDRFDHLHGILDDLVFDPVPKDQ